MVRAAALGVIDYSQADPEDKNWRIRHKLLLHEVQRGESIQLYDRVHRHWLAYISHGKLEPDSYDHVRERAGEALLALKTAVYPWVQAEADSPELTAEKDTMENDNISPETRDLIRRYKEMQARANAAAE